MAYVDQQKKARIAEALRAVMPEGWKYSLAVRHHSTIVLTIQSAPVDILANAKAVMLRGADVTDHLDVNEYWLDRQFNGGLLETFEKIKDALNTDNYNKSDTQTDYFDVGHYVDIKIGRWNKPFVYKPAAAATAVAEPVKSEDPAPYICGAHNDSDEGLIARALALLAEKHKPGLFLSSVADTADYLRLELGGLEHEIFGVIFLNNRHQVIAFEQMFRGTIDGASVHVREVLKRALQLNAAAVIFAHNHPSGFAEPSAADEQVTRRLRDALSLIDIRTLDHVIVASQGHVSMAERGLI